jgi:3-isopropylmalate dehydrogenase
MTGTTFDIAVMPGDGIGIEVTEAAIAVLRHVERRFGFRLDTVTLDAGALAYRRTGVALSDEALERAGRADAILFGAMGWPEIRYPDGTEIAPQLDLRAAFDLYAGVRPIRSIPGVPGALAAPGGARIDLVILRESTEGAFASRGSGVVEGRERASDRIVVTRHATERLSEAAFRIARARASRRGAAPRVTLVDKANVLRSFAFMRGVFEEVATRHPDVAADTRYVDAMALELVQRPWELDVLVMENLFGDILSDLGAGLIGGMGFAPSADLGERHGVFQPSHGSAPGIAGQGIANPTAAVLSAAMMLDWLGERHGRPALREASDAVVAAVDAAFAGQGLRPPDVGGRDGTAAVTSAIVDAFGLAP